MVWPSIMTKSKWKESRHFAMPLATSYFGFRPGPLSPMMAKPTDLAFMGSFRSRPEAVARQAIHKRTIDGLSILRHRIPDQIHDQVGVNIPKQQVMVHHAIFHFGWKLRKV